MITATICTIGDEILIGQIVDTNSAKISTCLNSIGVKVISMVSTSDTETDIINTIESALKTSNIVVITGGLGPTKDDITKKTLGKLPALQQTLRTRNSWRSLPGSSVQGEWFP
jgi:nicotinamide-nucleotide amidase